MNKGGDSLFVYKVRGSNAGNNDNKAHFFADLHIGKDVKVCAEDSYISLQNTDDSTNAPSFVLELNGSTLRLDAGGKAYYDHLQISAQKNSEIFFQGVVISKASLSLGQARLNWHNCEVDQFSLKSEWTSSVIISGSRISSWQQK